MNNIKQYLTEEEHFLYQQFKIRQHLRYKVKKAKIIYEYYALELSHYTDKAIGEGFGITKQAMNQKRVKLYNKLKRLGVEL